MFSPRAREAQAVVLFERATRVAARWKSGRFDFLLRIIKILIFIMLADILPQEAIDFRADFITLDGVIEKFQLFQIPMDEFQNSSSATARRLLVTHSLGYAATIQLHKSFASVNANSNQKCVNASLSMVQILTIANMPDVSYMNPIMGVR